MPQLQGLICSSNEICLELGSFMSQGSLQALSMTGPAALKYAFSSFVDRWVSIDMSQWPFALSEVRKEQAKARERQAQLERKRQRDRDGGALCSDYMDFDDIGDIDFDGIRSCLMAGLGGPIGTNMFTKSLGHILPGWNLFDSQVTNADLKSALKRIAPGHLQSLAVSSSQITNGGLAEALQDCTLQCLVIASFRSRCLTPVALSAAIVQHLRHLEIHDIPGAVAVVAQHAGELQTLFAHDVNVADLEALPKLRNLEKLKITVRDLDSQGNQPAVFSHIFKTCVKLKSIDMAGCSTDVSPELISIMEANLVLLEFFAGVNVHSPLTTRRIRQFQARFPNATISIDNIPVDWAFGGQQQDSDSEDAAELAAANHPVALANQGAHVLQAQVIDDIEHSQPPAVITPMEAAAIENEQAAGRIERLVQNNGEFMLGATSPKQNNCSDDSMERLIEAETQDPKDEQHGPDPLETAALLSPVATTQREQSLMALPTSVSISHDETDEPASVEPIFLLEYKRHAEPFRRALVEGLPLESCRQALLRVGLNSVLPSGAKVFVHPDHYRGAMDAIDGMSLRPYHVIVSRSLEHLVAESLANLPCRSGARVRSRCSVTALHEVDNSDYALAMDEDSNDDKGDDVSPEAARVEKYQGQGVMQGLDCVRSFLCVAHPCRNAESVSQSTTEVHGGGLNPRRRLSDFMADFELDDV